jgi:hypothetical protein
METLFGFLLFLLFTSLTAFSVWGVLYVIYLIVGFVLVIIKGILKDRRLSEAVNGDLDSETKDILALIMSAALIGISLSSGSWTPVEVGLCLGSVIFYTQVWLQTGGTFSIPFRSNKVMQKQEGNYKVTDLGKPIGDMSQEERRTAAEKIVQTMLDQAQNQKKDR